MGSYHFRRDIAGISLFQGQRYHVVDDGRQRQSKDEGSFRKGFMTGKAPVVSSRGAYGSDPLVDRHQSLTVATIRLDPLSVQTCDQHDPGLTVQPGQRVPVAARADAIFFCAPTPSLHCHHPGPLAEDGRLIGQGGPLSLAHETDVPNTHSAGKAQRLPDGRRMSHCLTRIVSNIHFPSVFEGA